MELSVKKALQRFCVTPLTFFARTLGLPKKLKRKGELVDALAHEMEMRLERVWGALSPTEQRLVAEVAYNGGSFDPAVFRAKYGERCPTHEPESWSREPSLVWLFCSLRAGSYVMPQSLEARIKVFAPKPRAPAMSALEGIPDVISDGRIGKRKVHIHLGNDFSLMELGSVLSLIKSSPIKVDVRTLRPIAHAEQRLADALIDFDFSLKILRQEDLPLPQGETPDMIRPHGWGVLVQQCGWCKPAGETLRLTDRGLKMLSEKSMEEFRRGVRRFIENDEFDELHRIRRLAGLSHYGRQFLVRPSERRRAIRRSMASWPQDRWIAFDEVFRFLTASDSGFSIYQESYRPSLRIGSEKEPFYSGEYLDRLYLRVFLFESLGVLGLVDLGFVHPAHLWPDVQPGPRNSNEPFFSRYDGLLFIRLNPLGGYCLDLGKPYEHRSTGPKGLFRVLPNHEIVVEKPEALPATARYMLTAIGKPVSEFVWRLDTETALKRLESRGKMTDVVDFLESHGSEKLPENVRDYLQDLGRKAARVVDSEEAIIVEMADEHAAAEIAGDRRTGKFCKVAAGRFVVVSRRDLRVFRNALRKLGYVLPC